MDTEGTNNQTFMNNPKHTSLKDLAQRLGVSIPTVSRALKDSPEISRELCAKAKHHRSHRARHRDAFLLVHLERH